MRLVALICGLVAGALALGAPILFDADVMAPFLALWPATEDGQQLARLAWFGLPALAAVAGLVALFAPGFAAIAFAMAGLGWLTSWHLLGNSLDMPLLAPAAIAGVGAAVAFVAGELALHRRRAERRERLAEEYDEELEPTADPAESAREAALQAEPPVGMPRGDTLGPAVEPLPLVLDEPEAAAQPVEIESYRPRRDLWPEAEPQPQPRRALVAEPVAREAEEEDEEPRRRGLGWIAAAAAIVVVLGLGGAAYYFLGGQRPATTDGPAAVAEMPATKPPVAVQLPVTPGPAPAPAEPPAEAARPAASAAVAAASYADPFSYCNAVGTIDRADYRYTGAPVTAAITAALGLPESAAPDRVRWRCAEGKVMACNGFAWPVCDVTPTVEEMRQFCAGHPTQASLTAPAGTWSCADGRPRLPADASWPVDDRGFLPSAWVAVAPPASG